MNYINIGNVKSVILNYLNETFEQLLIEKLTIVTNTEDSLPIVNYFFGITNEVQQCPIHFECKNAHLRTIGGKGVDGRSNGSPVELSTVFPFNFATNAKNPEMDRDEQWKMPWNADIRFNILIVLRRQINRIKVMFQGAWIGCTPLNRSLRPTIDILHAVRRFTCKMARTFPLNELFLTAEKRTGNTGGENASAISEGFQNMFRRV